MQEKTLGYPDWPTHPRDSVYDSPTSTVGGPKLN